MMDIMGRSPLRASDMPGLDLLELELTEINQQIREASLLVVVVLKYHNITSNSSKKEINISMGT
jgi:hypothetical protein